VLCARGCVAALCTANISNRPVNPALPLTQPEDHPSPVAAPELRYLKFNVYQLAD